MRPLPLDVIQRIAFYIPPSSTLVSLLCLSCDVHDALLPLLWKKLEIDDVQLHRLLAAYAAKHLISSRESSLSPPPPLPGDEMEMEIEPELLATGPTAPASAPPLVQQRMEPWNLVREITLWSPPSLETAHMMLPVLDHVSPSWPFPALQTLTVPFDLCSKLARHSRNPTYDLKKKSEKVRSAFIRIFRPSSLIILGSMHFPARPNPKDLRSYPGKAGPGIGQIMLWLADCVYDWICVQQVRWDGMGQYEACLIAGIRNEVIWSSQDGMLITEPTELMRVAQKVDYALSLCERWEERHERVGDTKIVWEGVCAPRALKEAQEKLKNGRESRSWLTVAESRQAVCKEAATLGFSLGDYL